MVVALIALAVAMSGTAYAATGGTFVLGKANTADRVSTLTNSAGSALTLKSGGTAPTLTLSGPSGSAPLSVKSTTKVTHLNADLVDGSNAADLSSTLAGSGIAGGPLPGVLPQTFHLTGQLSLVMLEGSGYRSTADGPGFIQITIFACAGVVSLCGRDTSGAVPIGAADTYSNEVESHKEMSVVAPFTLPAGAYTIGLQAADGTTTDPFDDYQVSVVSLG